MNSESAVKLALAVHKIADLLPEEEGTRYYMKDLASKLLVDFVLFVESSTSIQRKSEIAASAKRGIEMLESYFIQAEKRNWIDPLNFSILQKEYGTWKRFFSTMPEIQQMPTMPTEIEEV